MTRISTSQPFKNDPTPRGMHNYILDSLSNRCYAIQQISFWDEDDEEEETAVTLSVSRRKSNERRPTRRAQTSAWQEENDEPRGTQQRTTQSKNLTQAKRGRSLRGLVPTFAEGSCVFVPSVLRFIYMSH